MYQREIVFSIFKRPTNGKSLLWEFLYCIQLYRNVFLSSFCVFALCVCVRFSSSKLFHGKGDIKTNPNSAINSCLRNVLSLVVMIYSRFIETNR